MLKLASATPALIVASIALEEKENERISIFRLIRSATR
jgi:hypothetical protein